MTDTILCIDIGTTSLKAALLSDKKTVEAYSRQTLGTNENHNIAEEWIIALKKALDEMKQQNKEVGIEAICVSGNGPTVVIENGKLKNENGKMKNEKLGESFTLLWNEKVNNECDFDTLNHQDYKTTSLYIPRFQILKENFSEVWNNAKKIFSGPEYLIYRMTGSELSILPEERFLKAYWSKEEMEKCGFSESDYEKLPKFKKMGSFAGKISEKCALETGLLEGTFVFCGAPDFVVALLGTGTIYPGTVCDRAGSSEGINLCTSKPIFGEEIRTLPSFIPELWNASVLIEESGTKRFINGKLTNDNDNKLLSEFSEKVQTLKKCALENDEYFPDSIKMTGGQCNDLSWIKQKETAANIKINIPWCSDAELIGDLILTRVALGDYDDYDEAVFCLT